MSRSLTFQLLGVAALLCPACYAAPSEYEVKAAFLYNFVKFVEWPSTPGEQKGPLLLCVLGKDPFEGALEETAAGKRLNGRHLVIRQITEPAAARSCHVLFIAASESGRIAEILETVAASSVLTVSDIDRFCERGGMITFLMDGQRVRFRISSEAARHAGLKISSMLLQLAVGPGDKK
jgi:hypothetical protein